MKHTQRTQHTQQPEVVTIISGPFAGLAATVELPPPSPGRVSLRLLISEVPSYIDMDELMIKRDTANLSTEATVANSYTARMLAAHTLQEGRTLTWQHDAEINAIERSLGLIPSVGTGANGHRGYSPFPVLDAKRRRAAILRVRALDEGKGTQMSALFDDGLSMHTAFERLLAIERLKRDSCCPQEEELQGDADPEYGSRLDAQRVTLEFGSRSTRRVDGGKKPISDSPLFGGPAQHDLFKQSNPTASERTG